MAQITIPKDWNVKPPPSTGLNFGHSLANGLVGLWLFADRSAVGSYRDITGLMNAALQGTPTNPVATHGPMGPEALFTSDAYHLIGNPEQLRLSGPLSVGAWFRYPTSNLTNAPFVAKWLTGSWVLYVDHVTPDLIKFVVNAGGSKVAVSTNTYADNIYHLAIGVYDGANVRLYMDGGKEAITGDAATGSLSNTTENVVFGAYSDGGSSYGRGGRDGYLGMVFIYNRALSLAEARVLYAEPYAMFTPQVSSPNIVFVGTEAGPSLRTITPKQFDARPPVQGLISW